MPNAPRCNFSTDTPPHARRLGEGWADKKSVCNKFLQSCPVTCLIWPRGREDVVFGVADGKVKLGMLKTNKSYTLYTHAEGSYVVSLAASPNGQAVVCGHMDGSIYRCVHLCNKWCVIHVKNV